MFDGGDVVCGVAKTPLRQLVVQWIIGTYNAISQEMHQNAWRRSAEFYFILSCSQNINSILTALVAMLDC